MGRPKCDFCGAEIKHVGSIGFSTACPDCIKAAIAAVERRQRLRELRNKHDSK